jgi:hypothetical protein
VFQNLNLIEKWQACPLANYSEFLVWPEAFIGELTAAIVI